MSLNGKYLWIGIATGLFFVGLGIGYAIFSNTYNPYTMMGNPQFTSQYMGYMMQNPQLRQQMYSYMFQNKDFMYAMMGNQTFQNQYMGPWMMQNPVFQQNQNNFGGGMMGSSGMGPGMMNNYGTGPDTTSKLQPGSWYYKTVSINDTVNQINSIPTGAQVNNDNNTITFSSLNMDLTAFAMMGQDAVTTTGYKSSTNYDNSDVFVTAGMINPTLVVKPGTQLHITLINLDEDMSHNFVVTTTSPPYPIMPMRDASGFLNTMPVLPNEEKQQGHAYEYTDTISLSQPGIYWYICTYPGHAEEGMYGKIIVQ